MTTKELRELDAWIAEHVMKYRVYVAGRGDVMAVANFDTLEERTFVVMQEHPWSDGPKFNPSTDRAATTQVLEKCFETHEGEVHIEKLNGKYFIAYSTINAQAETLPLAICLFAKQLFSK